MSLETKLIALAQAIGADIKALFANDGDLSSLPTAAKSSLAAAIAEVHGGLAQKAPLASPALTGAPTAPTAATGTNTTQLATTAFVQQEIINDLANVAPLMAGAAAVGTSQKIARQDHVHPTDTSRAPLASPALTGTPTAPTAATGTNTTQLATTAFVRTAVAGTLVKSVAGGATVNLTAAEAGNAMLQLTGALTANIAVTVPAATGWWIVDNRTTGAYSVTIKTPTGTGVVVAQGKKRIVLCDGTNVLPATDDSDSLALTGIPTAPTAAPGTNTTQLANTAFVQAAVAALVASSPGTLDTLAELASALGNDPNFATTLATQMAARVRFDAAQTLSAAERLQACTNLGVGNPEADFVASYNAAKAA